MEPVGFDAGLMSGLTPDLLQDLLKLTCLLDEKAGVQQSETNSKTAQADATEAAQQAELERKLDEDIARVLGEEERNEEDHNADKRGTTPGRRGSAPLALLEEVENISPPDDEGAAATEAAASASGEGKPDGDGSEDEDTWSDDSDISSVCSCPREQNLDPAKEKSPSPVKEPLTPAIPPPPPTERTKTPPKELELPESAHLQLVEIQLASLRALSALLGHNHYLELLLVPRAHLVKDKSGQPSCSLQSQQACLQEAIRLAMKPLVRRAVQPMPITRPGVSVAQLQRAVVMLQHMAVLTQAESNSNIASKQGEQEALGE